MNTSLKRLMYLFIAVGLVNSSPCGAWGRWGYGGGWGYGSRWGWDGPAVYVGPGYCHDNGSAVVAGIGGLAMGAALANAANADPRSATEIEQDRLRAQELRLERQQKADDARKEREEEAAERRAKRKREREEETERKAKRKREKEAEEDERKAKRSKRDAE